MFTQDVLIFFANQYSLQGDDGRAISGTSVFYLDNPDLQPINNLTVNSTLGSRFCKSSLKFDDISKLKSVPGIYTGSFEPSTDAKGNLTLKLVDVSFKRDFGKK